MKALALLAIRLYQRWLSPLKGFACAYRVHTGGPSCSQLGYRAVRRFGVLGGVQVLDIRLALCADCHAERKAAVSARRRGERGSCDLPCDIPCDGADAACECLDCLDCDWNRKRNPRPTRRERQEARRRIREQRQRSR